MTPVPTWPIVGHASAVRLLQRSLADGHLAHAYLLVGPPNVGKTTLGLTFAQALLCEDEAARSQGVACGRCVGCRKVRERTHPDLRVVEPDGGSGDDNGAVVGESGDVAGAARSKRKAASRVQIKIDTVRDIQRDLSLRPYQGVRRVVLLPQADTLNDAAENALLKTLEEPPPYALLILTAEDAETLLPTTVSRCQQVPLNPVPAPAIAEALVALGQPPDEAARLARLSGGRVGWALQAARDTNLLAKRVAHLDGLARVLKAPRAERLALAEEMAKKPDALPDLLLLWQGWWRDALLTQVGCGEWVTNIDQQAWLDQAAGRRSLETLAQALRATRQTADELERNANPRLALEVLFLSWPES